jgi:hypothetical protein
MSAQKERFLTRIISSPAIAPAKMLCNQRNPLDAVYRRTKMSRFTKFLPLHPDGATCSKNLPDFDGAKTHPAASID